MRAKDFLQLSLSALATQTLRSVLTALGIAVGIAAVVLLTAIGEGVHRFVLTEFVGFGTNLISVTPGKTTTTGMVGGVVTNVRPLTIDDALALERVRGVKAVLPLVQGNAPVKVGNLSRRTTVQGVGHQMPELWQIDVAKGRFLPADDPTRARQFVVLGSRMAEELFDQRSPLGELIHIGGERYRVIGVMKPKGQMLGVDLDDTAFIPTARAMAMFNQEGVMEISLLFQTAMDPQKVVEQIHETLTRLHGSEDFSITTQDEMLNKLGSILNIVTMAIGGLGGISLVVGGVGILTIMTISVGERTAEIGLLRAIGARRRHILTLFLLEAIALSTLGGIAGLIIGAGGAWLLGLLVPDLPVHVSAFYAFLAVAIAFMIGLLAGVTPARNAAQLDPVEALRTE
jgi:putative ABC transport system permease protein